MQRIISALLVAALLGATVPTPTVDPKIVARAKDWLHRAQTGDVDRSQMNARLNAGLTPDVVKGAAEQFSTLGTPSAFILMDSHGTTYDFLVTFPRGQFIWEFALDPDGKIAGLSLSPYAPPAHHMNDDAVVAALREKLTKNSQAGDFSGAVIVARNGTPVFEQAYGLADRETNTPNTLQTRFRIGSMNKMFTAVAIMQLVQAGKIDLNATVGTYLPDYPNKDVATEVTVHQLLTHTGGTGDFFGPVYDKHRLELRTLDDYVKLFGASGVAFRPGSKFDYSNYGFILLGVIVEKVSGESYYDYVRDHVYEPAGMTATGSDPEDSTVADRSVGYTTDDNGKVHPNTDELPYRGTSAGGGYSTVGDLLSFANALVTDKLLNAANTKLLTTGKVDMPGSRVSRRYAYGFGDAVINGTHCFGHDGGAPGMSGDIEICPEAGYVVAVLANIDPPVADNTADFVVSRLPLKN